MNEAMGLASMNPMVGPGSNKGNILTNSLSRDKDLSGGWGEYSVSKTLDKGDISLKLDDNGKVIKNNIETLGESYIASFYVLNPGADVVFENLLRESNKPYEERTSYPKNYIYEAMTGHYLYTPDQAKYDSLLEEIELDKMSKAVGAVNNDSSFSFEHFKKEKREKDSNYIPDSKSPFNTLENHIPILDPSYKKIAEEVLSKLDNKHILIFEDYKGFYGFNESTGKRTESYSDIRDIYFDSILRDEGEEL